MSYLTCQLTAQADIDATVALIKGFKGVLDVQYNLPPRGQERDPRALLVLLTDDAQPADVLAQLTTLHPTTVLNAQDPNDTTGLLCDQSQAEKLLPKAGTPNDTTGLLCDQSRAEKLLHKAGTPNDTTGLLCDQSRAYPNG